MDHLFRDLTTTLSQAQQAVERELDQLTSAPVRDLDRLGLLGRSVGEFSYEADTLLVMMLERDADGDLMGTAEALVDFFRDTDERIAALLKVG
jgi:hypothetical protein